jgi:hypothetical protein
MWSNLPTHYTTTETKEGHSKMIPNTRYSCYLISHNFPNSPQLTWNFKITLTQKRQACTPIHSLYFTERSLYREQLNQNINTKYTNTINTFNNNCSIMTVPIKLSLICHFKIFCFCNNSTVHTVFQQNLKRTSALPLVQLNSKKYRKNYSHREASI